jgi:hypothetical protein
MSVPHEKRTHSYRSYHNPASSPARTASAYPNPYASPPARTASPYSPYASPPAHTASPYSPYAAPPPARTASPYASPYSPYASPYSRMDDSMRSYDDMEPRSLSRPHTEAAFRSAMAARTASAYAPRGASPPRSRTSAQFPQPVFTPSYY